MPYLKQNKLNFFGNLTLLQDINTMQMKSSLEA